MALAILSASRRPAGGSGNSSSIKWQAEKYANSVEQQLSQFCL
jgi:hypothetical protein